MRAYNGTPAEWNQLLLQFSDAHILQTWEWGVSKIRNGWTPKAFVWQNDTQDIEACVLILRRELKLGFLKLRVLYSPKGPALTWTDDALRKRVLNDLQAYAKAQKAIFLKIDPDVLLGTGVPGTEEETVNQLGQDIEKTLQKRGWLFSQDQIQFRNTVLIDLTREEEEILAAMKQKTRYNIRLAARRGVKVRQATLEDLPVLYRIYAQTAIRDDFVIRGQDYYLELWQSFMQAGMCHALIADVEDEPVAGLFIMHFNRVARYMYGMSTEKFRELMPNHLLQWEAIKLSKQLGYESYDMWGAPDVFDESDSMWGVYRFKEGFNGITARHIGAWDFPARPWLYKLYTNLLPRFLDLMRQRGKQETRKTISE